MMTESRGTMNRPMVITELHAMVHSRLFSRRPWLPDKEACCAMFRKLHDLGLEEEVPGQPGSTQETNLGTELSMPLMMVFMGLWGDWDMAMILEEYGLIDELERDNIYDKLEDGVDPERVLLRIVQRAYFDFYNPTRLSH